MYVIRALCGIAFLITGFAICAVAFDTGGGALYALAFIIGVLIIEGWSHARREARESRMIIRERMPSQLIEHDEGERSMELIDVFDAIEQELEGLEANEIIAAGDPEDNLAKSVRRGRADAFGESRAIIADMRKVEEEHAPSAV